MRKLALGLAMVAGLFLMTGCESMFAPLTGMGTFETGAAGEASPQQALADRVFGEAIGPEERSVRAHMVVWGYSELAVEASRADPGRGAELVGNLMKLRQQVAAVAAADYDGITLETDLARVQLDFGSALINAAASAIRADILGLLDGIDVGAVGDRLELRARQSYLVPPIVRDVRRTIEELRAGTRTAEEIEAVLDAKIDANVARISGLS